MSTIQERIHEEIKNLQKRRADLDRSLLVLSAQNADLSNQYKILGTFEGMLQSLLDPTVGEVVGAGAGKSSVPPLSEIKKANANIFSAMTLAEAIKWVLSDPVFKKGAKLQYIAEWLVRHGYKSKSKNLRGLISQCLGEPKNKKLFKRVSKGVYVLRAKA